MLVTEERRLNKLIPLDALIILSVLKNRRRAKLADLALKIQKRESAARKTVEQLVELGMVEGIGNGKARQYMLSSKVYALSGNETGYTRQRGMTTFQEMEMIERFINNYGEISRAKTADLCKCDSNHAYYLLQKMYEKGRVDIVKKGKYTVYICKKSEQD